MDTTFDRETAITKLGDGRYSATMATSWWVVRGPNGGYLAAIILRALTDAVDDPERTPALADGPLRERAGRGRRRAAHRARAGRTLAHDVHVPHGAERQARRARGRRVLEAASRPGVLRHRHAPGARARVLRPVAPRPREAPPIASRYETRWAIGHPPVPGTPGRRACGRRGLDPAPRAPPGRRAARRGDHRRLAPADVQPDPGAGRRPDRRPDDPLPRRPAAPRPRGRRLRPRRVPDARSPPTASSRKTARSGPPTGRCSPSPASSRRSSRCADRPQPVRGVSVLSGNTQTPRDERSSGQEGSTMPRIASAP